MYEKTITLYWVIKGKFESIPTRKRGEAWGGKVEVAFWKELYSDTCLLHMKIDAVGEEIISPISHIWFSSFFLLWRCRRMTGRWIVIWVAMEVLLHSQSNRCFHGPVGSLLIW